MTMRLQVETDRPLIAGDSMTRYALATVVAPEGAPRQRPPVNLGLVLDRSGSMTGEKIRLAKDAAVAAIRRLDAHDRFSVVAYDDQVEVVIASATASRQAIEEAARAILRIQARGSTDLCGGWLSCCEQLALAEGSEVVTRVLLLTDGLANVGITDPAEIVGHARELRKRGISTTTIGVGEDFDEHLLGAMSDEGGGHFYYVERDEQIPDVVNREVGETLEVTVRGAQLRVGPASLATVVPIANYPTRREGDEWVIELGDLVSNQELNLPVRVSFGSHGVGGPIGSPVRLSFSVSGGPTSPVSEDVVWTIVTGPEVGAQARNRRVDRAVAQAYAALARREAGRLNRDGDFTGASRRLTVVARRIRSYAGDDPLLRELVALLEKDAVVHEVRMGAAALKAGYMVSERHLKGRDQFGGSLRRPGNRP
jgi:Ca-activated chloride channel family protein